MPFAIHLLVETQVVLEALASGLPVVGLKAEGVRDLVEDGETGLLLDFDDLVVESKASSPAQIFDPQAPTFQIAVSRYSRLLIDLSRDREKRARMASAAVSKANEFSWSNAMEDVLDIFRDLIEGGGDDGLSDSSFSPASVPLSRTSSFGFDPVGGVSPVPPGNRNIRSLVSQASTFLLRRRFGRLPGSPGSVLVDISRWRTSDGLTQSGEGLLEAEIEERATCKLDDLQLAYFKSGGEPTLLVLRGRRC